MKTIQEFIIDNKLEKYLLENLNILLELYRQQIYPEHQITESLFFEALSQLDNLKGLYEYIANYIIDKIPSDFKDGSTFTINVSKINSYFKYVILKIYRYDLEASYVKSKREGNKIYIELKLPIDFKNLNNKISALILHELLHAYEDCQRKSQGKLSIFDELTEEYRTAFQYKNHKDLTTRQIAILKYFFNPKERRAYISTLEIDIENIIKKHKELSLTNFKPSDILNKLKKETIWKNYFDFGKFVLDDLNNIDDYKLEEAYYRATIPDEQKSKEGLELLNNARKNGIKFPKQEFKIKANEIREECRNTYEKFNKKFSVVFLKVLSNYLQKNTKRYL